MTSYFPDTRLSKIENALNDLRKTVNTKQKNRFLYKDRWQLYSFIYLYRVIQTSKIFNVHCMAETFEQYSMHRRTNLVPNGSASSLPTISRHIKPSKRCHSNWPSWIGWRMWRHISGTCSRSGWLIVVTSSGWTRLCYFHCCPECNGT